MASKKPQIEVETSWMKEKLDIWVALPDSEKTNICYKRGIIIKVVGQDVTIRNENGNEEVVHASRVSAANSYLDLPDGFDDMVDMEHLSEAELLYNLHERYKTGKIFTYVGPTLIVLNPYCMIPELFTAEVLAQFQNSVRELRFEPKDLMPHVYALGAASMTNLIRDQKNQAIVISGESGAGKTENTKFAMKFLTSLNDAGGKKKSDEVSIEDKILACNPVLEAFGNAKTVRNDNSSRFGKYVSLLVAKGSNQRILGATITNYLLEKSRVCLQSNGERNYHIFYHLFKGASIKELEALYLAKDGVSLMEKFEYLNKSGCYVVPTLDDKELYDEVVTSFRTMEFKPDEQRAIWALVASTLLLGQLRYDDSTLTDKAPCKFVDETPLKQACELLELDYEETSKAIRYKFRSVQGQVIESPLNKMDCVVTRDSLSKELYNKLFTWLVKRLNFTVMPAEMLEDGADTMQLLNNYYHIGLLDIFGFEIFKFNSLEQLCINYTNEKLQQLYIFYVFKNEEKVFIQEGLQDFLCELNFEDNQPVIDLLDAPPVGIFQMIDESSQVNMTDENLCSKIIKQHGTNPKLTTPKMSKLTFIVNHTASSVEYNTDGFAFKNRDELSPYIEKALFNSKFEMVPKVYKGLCGNQKESEEAGAKKDAKTDKFLGAKFRLQMKDLMTELQSCDCHFIRCIKPNDRKEKKLFLPYLTLQQIMYMGILDTIKVRKDSYPIRRLYRTFFQKYGELSTKHAKKSFEQHCKDGADFKAMSLDLLQEAASDIKKELLLIGNTRVFMRIPAELELNKRLEKKMRVKVQAVKRIQRFWMKYCWYKKLIVVKAKILRVLRFFRKVQNRFRVRKEYLRFQRIRKASRKIGRWWRALKAKWHRRKLRKCATKIQAWWRSIFYKKRLQKMKIAAAKINKVMRGALVRQQKRRHRYVERLVEEIIRRGAQKIFEKVQNKKALILQTRWRGYRARKKNKAIITQAKQVRENFVFNKNALIIQRVVRGVIVRKALKRLHAAANLIQGFYRMCWYSSVYKNLKASTLVIQRNVLRWLYTKRIVQDRNQNYLPAARTDLENRRKLEITTLFGGIKDQKDPDALNRVKKVDAYSNKKINLFMKVIDLDVVADTSDIYDPSWSVQLLELQNAVNENTDVELQMIDVGEAHTLAISNNPKVYGWGWNDHFQLVTLSQPGGGLALSPEEIKFPVADFRPKQFAAGDEHNILLDTNNNLFVWGSNRKAQFGLGHCNEVGCMTNISFTNGDRVTAVKAKGHNNLAITESGAAYYWPLYKLSGDVVTRPVMMSLPPKIQIQSGSCGFNFAILLSRNGLLFSFGIDNSAGQLGLGHTSPKEEPMLIETLKTEGERVTEVSCGYKHVICKTALGKVYTWGWGEKGQLGNNSLSNSKVPRLLDTSIIGVTKSKVVQVQAGFRHSLILAESRRVYWMGTNGSMINNARLTELDLSGKIPSFTNATDLAPIKILTAWSKTMSVTYLTIADTRTVDQPNPAKDKILSLMIQKLDEYSAHADLDLPLVDHVSKYFVARAVKATAEVSPFKARTMPSTTTNAQASKRVNVTSFNTPKSQTMKPFFLSKAREDALSHIKEVPEYIAPKEVASSPQKPNLTDRLTDASPKKSSPTKSSPTTKEQEKSRKPAIIIPESPKALTTPIQLTPKDMSSQKQASDVEMKLREIKRKFDKLVLIPKEKWNEKEREFMKIATDPKVFKKLEQIK